MKGITIPPKATSKEAMISLGQDSRKGGAG